MPADLIVFALIAAGLIFWLRSILGTRNEGDGERANPYLRGDPDAPEAPAERTMSAEALVAELAANSKGSMGIENKTAENALVEIAQVSRDFDIYRFLSAAQDAFVFIVESFADGDRETLEELLDPAVYTAFDGAITAREKDGQKLEAEIRAITKSEVTAARLEGRKAFITVRFEAEEVTATRDQDGNVIAGNPDKAKPMRDLWTFAKDLKSRDPRWLVVETRADIDGDNDTVPNSL
ncbi:MAG: Tim44 domain-containing protein [Alphaproteobacteria bacterium]|nr:Tim44 domain-containing protein [Alphaproteobacteria bacterium]